MEKRLILIIILLILLSYLTAYIYTFPIRIQHQILKANYCEESEDCVNLDFGVPFGCGDYVNIKEANRLKKMTSFSNILPPSNLLAEFSCVPPPVGPTCLDNKCVPKECDIEKYYTQFTYFADRECECPRGTKMYNNKSGMICLAT